MARTFLTIILKLQSNSNFSRFAYILVDITSGHLTISFVGLEKNLLHSKLTWTEADSAPSGLQYKNSPEAICPFARHTEETRSGPAFQYATSN